MALCTVRFFSQSLGKASEMVVVLPDGGEGPFPVLYLLHGLSDDAFIWLRRSRVESRITAPSMPICSHWVSHTSIMSFRARTRGTTGMSISSKCYRS